MAVITLTGNKIYLRALEPEDLAIVHRIENDESLWELSSTLTPYSKYTIKEYLENAHRDIYEVKQLRLVICKTLDDTVLGMIDLFDYDPKNQRAGVGILILEQDKRGQGYGTEALQMIINYCFAHLDMHQLYANILEDNNPSIQLFKKQGFV